ncbi:MAG TPA: L-threonylcarbamoyladenylate synthase [Gryllotalpicola sp.]
MPTVYDCSDPDQARAGILAAREALERGELIVFPTDTVYGIAADAFNAAAVQRLHDAKGSGRQSPPAVLVADTMTLNALASRIPAAVHQLTPRFWPGGLTLVLPAQPSLQWDLGETAGTVALRMPDHAIALELLRTVGPLAVSGANTVGLLAALTAADAVDMLGDDIAVYLDGGEAGLFHGTGTDWPDPAVTDAGELAPETTDGATTDGATTGAELPDAAAPDAAAPDDGAADDDGSNGNDDDADAGTTAADETKGDAADGDGSPLAGPTAEQASESPAGGDQLAAEAPAGRRISTILDATGGAGKGKYRILRPGVVSAEQLRIALGDDALVDLDAEEPAAPPTPAEQASVELATAEPAATEPATAEPTAPQPAPAEA